ncbi:Transcriptional elongation regulator MINIYO [Linum perenne]
MEQTVKSEVQRTHRKKAPTASTTLKNSGEEKPGVFGANKVTVGEDAALASFLIGSIVEKGISESTSSKPIPPPTPSVFPFPVARHRAHGPYWNALTNKNDDDEAEEGDGDDDPTDFDPISSFANPVQRKERKGLDLSRREEDGKRSKNGVSENSTRRLKKDVKVVDDVNSRSSLSEVPMAVDETLASAAYVGTDSLHRSYERACVADVSSHSWKGVAESTEEQIMRVKEIKPVFSGTSNGVSSFGVAQRSTGLESEIDAENHARIQNMSPEEIAEARAELMEKMNPSLLNLLKRRGQQKLNKQSLSESDVATKNEPANGPPNKDSSAHLHVANGGTDMMKTSNSINADTLTPNSVKHDSDPSSSKSWNTWSERVEAARRLRFSLEGNVISADYETGCTPNEPGDAISSVAERDFLRTEGDPGAAGYSIHEAVQLTRSVIPGQRGLALHLLASVLDKAMHNIRLKEVANTVRITEELDKFTDWEAVWAYALGPEPELVLTIRMCLDDNHSSVVLACTKVIQSVLSYDSNERIFQISEKLGTYGNDLFTAPVFRSKPEINGGFLHGGFWKYSAKPSNILAYAEDIMDDDNEEEPTIQDDIVVAGQDFAAGLVRMGILPRMCYLLEANPTDALEESILSILVTIARHSPTCVTAIMKCQGLVKTVVKRFRMDNNMDIRPSKIKSVRLMKLLAQSGKDNCIQFLKDESFHGMTQHLYWYTSSLDEWMKLGKENCRLSSALRVEQLQFWKVCINYGFCISDFADIFPALCFWLNPPTFEKIKEENVVGEFTSISKEAYLVLEALARKLPNFYLQKHKHSQNPDIGRGEHGSWSWSYVPPVVELALKWITWKSDQQISGLFKSVTRSESDFQDSSATSLLWVYSAVMQLLSTLLLRVKPEDTATSEENGWRVPWLPEFVPKIGLEIVKNEFLGFGDGNAVTERENFGVGSFVSELCQLRQRNKHEEVSLASVSCLNAILLLVRSVDDLIQSARRGVDHSPSQGYSSSSEGKVLVEGILKLSIVELRCMLDIFTKLVTQDFELVQSIEVFSRGGPAPGVGLGWGATGGGFWSLSVFLGQADSKLLIDLLEIFKLESSTDSEMASTAHRINSVLRVCLTAGPRDTYTAEKALDFLLQAPVLSYLDACRQCLSQLNNGGSSALHPYTEEEYQLFSKTLASHFRNRWLSVKKKSKPVDGNKSSSKSDKAMPLETIHEEDTCTSSSTIIRHDQSCTSFATEWAHQRLPLPMHWFLSPISEKKEPVDTLEVVRAGLFFLLGVEAMSSLLPNIAKSPVRDTPLVWKLHSLSVALLIGMGVLDDDKSKDVFEVLQNLYGRVLDETRSINFTGVEFLRFKSEIHETYSTFLEALVDKFSADSYGDLVFGRQIAIFLHRCTETPVRLSAWTVLSTARVLELLPSLEKCVGQADGYLQPIENDEAILDGYVKSWVSGALDRAATRGSMAFTLSLHHLSSFIFGPHPKDTLTLRNKLARSLIRDYSQKPNHQDMMVELVKYNKSSTENNSPIAQRFEVLVEACDGNSSLLSEVEKLKSALTCSQ